VKSLFAKHYLPIIFGVEPLVAADVMSKLNINKNAWLLGISF